MPVSEDREGRTKKKRMGRQDGDEGERGAARRRNAASRVWELESGQRVGGNALRYAG